MAKRIKNNETTEAQKEKNEERSLDLKTQKLIKSLGYDELGIPDLKAEASEQVFRMLDAKMAMKNEMQRYRDVIKDANKRLEVLHLVKENFRKPVLRDVSGGDVN